MDHSVYARGPTRYRGGPQPIRAGTHPVRRGPPARARDSIAATFGWPRTLGEELTQRLPRLARCGGSPRRAPAGPCRGAQPHAPRVTDGAGAAFARGAPARPRRRTGAPAPRPRPPRQARPPRPRAARRRRTAPGRSDPPRHAGARRAGWHGAPNTRAPPGRGDARGERPERAQRAPAIHAAHAASAPLQRVQRERQRQPEARHDPIERAAAGAAHRARHRQQPGAHPRPEGAWQPGEDAKFERVITVVAATVSRGARAAATPANSSPNCGHRRVVVVHRGVGAVHRHVHVGQPRQGERIRQRSLREATAVVCTPTRRKRRRGRHGRREERTASVRRPRR